MNTLFAWVFCTPFRGMGGEHTGEMGNAELLRIEGGLYAQIKLCRDLSAPRPPSGEGQTVFSNKFSYEIYYS